MKRVCAKGRGTTPYIQFGCATVYYTVGRTDTI